MNQFYEVTVFVFILALASGFFFHFGTTIGAAVDEELRDRVKKAKAEIESTLKDGEGATSRAAENAVLRIKGIL